MSLAHYSPEDVTVLLAGVKPIEGFQDGTFISIKKDVPVFKTYRTSDGKIARLKDNDASYTITLTLMSTSPSNNVLDAWMKLDQISSMAKIPMIIKDELGSSLFFSTTTWIEEPPELTFATSTEPRTWVLRSSQGIMNVGGNEDANDLVDDFRDSILSTIPILQGVL